ncbi:MAG: alcohol dehydrogenase catalytic domain-containing protein [Desulfobacterales bacterium]|nr:MAG: alcohol dehydrogenase catalytic domain-containing protein [Desulfobacterales bacterium]
MKALVYKGAEIIELEDIEPPAPAEDESLIKVRAVGICGSDFEGFLGKTGRRTPPMVMGHELAGTVEIPAAKSRFKKGDNIVVQPKLYCGACAFCARGLTNLCPGAEFFGVMSKNGGMAEYLAAPERCLHRVREDLELQKACMTEPLAVAYRAAHQVPNNTLQRAGYTVLVGAGTIGLLILQVIKLRGARNIIVSDMSDFRLEIAQQLGADFRINPQKEDFLARIQEITAHQMADVAFEAVGFGASVSQAHSALKNGGTIIWVGLAQRMIEIDMHRIVTAELNVRGSFLYSEEDFVNSLKLIETGQIQVEPIITRLVCLEEGLAAFKSLQNNPDGRVIKIILQR